MNFHGFGQHHKTQVAVEALGSRRAQRLFPVNLFVDIVLGRSAGDEIDPAGSFRS